MQYSPITKVLLKRDDYSALKGNCHGEVAIITNLHDFKEESSQVEFYFFFDNDCDICKSSVSWLQKGGTSVSIAFLPNIEISNVLHVGPLREELLSICDKKMVGVNNRSQEKARD